MKFLLKKNEQVLYVLRSLILKLHNIIIINFFYKFHHPRIKTTFLYSLIYFHSFTYKIRSVLLKFYTSPIKVTAKYIKQSYELYYQIYRVDRDIKIFLYMHVGSDVLHKIVLFINFVNLCPLVSLSGRDRFK